MSGDKWVLTIEHGHGGDSTLYDTVEQAEAALLKYVHEWWHQIAGTGRNPVPTRPPSDSGEAIETYFNRHPDGESYIISPLSG